MIEVDEQVAERFIRLIERPLHLAAFLIGCMIVVLLDDHSAHHRQMLFCPRIMGFFFLLSKDRAVLLDC